VSATLYFDGDCAMCSRTAWFIDRRDRVRTLRFVALESDEGRALRAERPELSGVDSLLWVERDGSGAVVRLLTHSDAAIAVATYLGGGWRLVGIGLAPIPRQWRDAAYRLVARHRRRL
jgi:predicted DCC family thiol-disulfide oxidoreductase YuxK